MKYTLSGQSRTVTKKQVSKLRRTGFVPAAIFGYKGNLNIQVDTKLFSKTFSDAGHTSIVDVEVDGTVHSILIDEVQLNPVTREVTHASLREVRMDEEITMEIPLELSGSDESPAVKDEEQLIILTVAAVEVKGLPGNLPSELVIDVSAFHAGDTFSVDQLVLPEGVSIVKHEEESSDEEGEEQPAMVLVTTVAAGIEEDSPLGTVEETPEGEVAAEGEAGAKTEEKADAEEKPAK